MNTTRRQLIIATAAAGLPAVTRAQSSLTYEGQSFALVVKLGGADLRLNGTGVRQVAWFKGYLAALYLTAPARTAAQVVATPGPKRLQLRMLHEVPAVEFSKALRKGVARNVPPSSLPALQERVDSLAGQIDALGKVRKKDVVDLDFEPGRGLLMSLNGSVRGTAIAGDDFFNALLLSFVGDIPYDDKMRAGLLGQRP